MESFMPNGRPTSGTKGDTQFVSRTLARVVIQEIATGRYYQGPGLWTADIQRACDFHTGSAARECATRLKLSNAQVVMTQEFTDRQVFPLGKNVKAAA